MSSGGNSGVDCASGSSSSSSSTPTSSDSESQSEEEDEANNEVIYTERKRKIGNVGAVDLNEQSVLKDGYLLPAIEGGQSDSEPEPEEATKVEPPKEEGDDDPPLQSAVSQRRLAILLQETENKQQPENEDQAQKGTSRDPASAFRLAWEEDEKFPIFAVQASSDPVLLEKAIMHYRSLPQAESRQYHCLVNLACCLMTLNRHRQAKALLEQAAGLQPARASAQLDLIHCCLRIRHRAAALQAIGQALRNAEDLTAEDHRLLLSTRKELNAIMSKSTEKSSGQGRSGRKADSVRRRVTARYQVFTRLEAWQMRKELLALRSAAEAAEDLKPPWRRHHIYSEDSEQAIYSKKARWQPLTPEALQNLREACSKVEKYREAKDLEQESQDSFVLEDTDSESDEGEETNTKLLKYKAARRAYECIKNLPCMQALAEEKAIALLQAGEILDFEADCQIFEEGDPALDVYVIVNGSVSIRVLMPELAADPIPVQSLYDGQVFGDAKVAAWKDAQAPPPRRQAGARTQEETCLLRIPAPAYRQALGLDGKSRKDGEGEEEEAALLPEVRRKVQALSRSPLFEGAAANNLVLLATNVQEVALRHDDVFVEVNQALQACFLISEGYVRVSVPAVDMEAKLGSLEDASRILGMGRLPDAKMKITNTGAASQFPGHPHSSRTKGRGNQRRTKSPASPKNQGQKQPKTEPGASRFAKLGEVPVFQLGERPLLLPPTSSLASHDSGRPSRFVARKPGTPRRGTTWEKSLRQDRVEPFMGCNGLSGDIEMCLLHAGEAFGLGSLFDPKGECSYLSSCEVRVQSSEAKILVLTPGSLLYLNETLARSLVDKAKNQEDPVAPSLKNIKRERLNRSHWIVRKQHVLHRVVMQED